MHYIIKTDNEDKSFLGGKAENLIEMDKMNIVPEFVVISNDFLCSEFCGKKAESSHVFSSDFKSKINSYIDFLGSEALIVRSSYGNEDSTDYSYAGIFLSRICNNRQDLFSIISEVWNSYFSERVALYEKMHCIKPLRKMGIIIQKYIKPDYGGVMFYNNSENWVYAEVAEGTADKVVNGENLSLRFFEYLGQNFLSSVAISADLRRKLYELADYVRRNPLCEKYYKADIEFVICDGIYYILQIRPLTAKVDPFLCDYVFPRLEDHDEYSYEDVDFKFITEIMSKYGFLIPDLKINSGINYADGRTIKKIIDYSFLLSLDKKVSESLYKEILKILYSEIHELKSKVKSHAFILLKKIKKINFRISFIKWIMRLLEQNIEMELMSLGGVHFWNNNIKKGFKKNIQSTTSKKKNRKFSNIERIVPNLFFLNQNTFSCKGIISEQFFDIQVLNDNLTFLNNSLLNIEKIYNKIKFMYHNLISQQTHYTGNITNLCRLPYEQAVCMLDMKKEVKSVPFSKPKKDFPLRGITVYPGEIEGQALIINSKETLSECAGKIIIAKFLTPDLGIAVCLLSSKNINTDLVDSLSDSKSLSDISRAIGIVTQYGGIASHAAIISREFGIPCLVGCEGVIDSVNNGDIVRIAHNSLHLVKKHVPDPED